MSLPACPFSRCATQPAVGIGAASITDSPPVVETRGSQTGAGPSSQTGGFTLVEVLVATALLATLGAIVFGSLVTTTQVVDSGRAQSGHDQMVRRLLRLMANEVAISRNLQMFPWIGLNGTQDGQPADTLAFLSMADPVGTRTGSESETIRVVYTREADRLMRFARRNLYGLTDESVDQLVLADQVKAFNVRYYDAQARIWMDEWSTITKMPKAVLFEITFQHAQDAEPWVIREWVTIGAS